MPITLERDELHSLIRLEGECGLGSVVELKSLLLAELASGRELQVTIEPAGTVDIAVLQLLWAAEREGPRSGARVTIRMSDTVVMVAREAGFEGFPVAAVER